MRGGVTNGIREAERLGINTIQLFSHSPRTWKINPLPDEEIESFKRLRRLNGIAPVFVHASYLINLASKNERVVRDSISLLSEEMRRADVLGAEYVVLHTGSASGEDPRSARRQAVRSLLEALDDYVGEAGLLLENTSGQRGDITPAIADLGEIIDGVSLNTVAGICVDTCHAFAAGCDVRTPEGVDEMLSSVDKNIGADKLKLIHLNDSKGDLGSNRDRHEHIGKGEIGIEGFLQFLSRKEIRAVPMILETPKKRPDDDPMNLTCIRKLIEPFDGED